MSYISIPYDHLSFYCVDLAPESSKFLDACYEVCQCSSIEVAPTRFPGIVMIIDEEGKCKDGWNKKINPFASHLYPYQDVIVGNVLLASVNGEDLCPLSDVEQEAVLQLLVRFAQCKK